MVKYEDNSEMPQDNQHAPDVQRYNLILKCYTPFQNIK